MTTITVVTIARNDLSGIQRTFASLAQQTNQDVQHVIIDGESSDGTAEWAEANSVFSDTTVLSEPDRGIYDAMNKGLRLTHGKVVCFLNSGDYFCDGAVLTFVAESYDSEGWTWALGLGQMVDQSSNPVRRRQRRKYSWIRQTFWHYEVCHQAVFMQSEFVRALGGFDERFSIAADYHLMTKAGHLVRPVMWPRMLAYTLEGGLSDRSLEIAHWEAHAARVEALELKGPLVMIDRAWSHILIAKTRCRRLVRRHLRARGRTVATADLP
jgi:glycosyltransferase involved in cell wall biosynthesis